MGNKQVTKIELEGKSLNFDEAVIALGKDNRGRPVFKLDIVGQEKGFYNLISANFKITTSDGMCRTVNASMSGYSRHEVVYYLAGNPFDMQEPMF